MGMTIKLRIQTSRDGALLVLLAHNRVNPWRIRHIVCAAVRRYRYRMRNVRRRRTHTFVAIDDVNV